MAKLAIKKASTDVTTYVFIQDSSKTTGVGLAGLAYNTTDLVASYVRPLGTRQALTLATLAAADSAHSDGGFKEVDATNMPGVYRLDLPDAVCATGVPSVVVMLKGAANMSPVVLELQLTDLDPNTAAITAAAVADAVWDEATADHTTASSFGALDANVDAILADTGTDGVKIASAQTVATVTNLTNLPTMPTDWVTAAGLKADAVTKIQSGLATSAALTTVDANVDSILADTGTDGVKIADTQGAITWGQQKIIADVAYEGALDIRNSHTDGVGLLNGGSVAQLNAGVSTGVNNSSSNGIGMMNEGRTGLRNIGSIKNVTGFDTDMISQIRSGLATAAALTTVDNEVGVIDGIVDAIKAKTDNLPLSPASSGEYTSALTAIQNDLDNPNQYKADVSNLALEATLTAIKGAGWMDETLVALKTAIDNVTGGGATAQQIWEYATRTLSAATNLPSAADISDAVWNEATTDHTTAGSTGAALTDILTDTSTTLDNKLDIIDVVADTIYAEMGSSAEVADVVWDELLAGHVIGGSAGEKIAAIKAKTDLMNASAITYTPTVSGTTITLRRGDTLSAPLTDTGALTGYVSIDFTVKRRMSDLDDDAIIRIRKNASGTNDGLLRLNAAAPTSSALGSIIVNDVTTGDITITLDETATDDLDTGGYLYDVQLIDADSVLTLTYGKLSVVADVTRAVS